MGILSVPAHLYSEGCEQIAVTTAKEVMFYQAFVCLFDF